MSAHMPSFQRYEPLPFTRNDLARHTLGFKRSRPTLIKEHGRRIGSPLSMLSVDTSIPQLTRYEFITSALVSGIQTSFPSLGPTDDCHHLRQARARLEALFAYEGLLREDQRLAFRELGLLHRAPDFTILFPTPEAYQQAVAYSLEHHVPLDVAYVHAFDEAHS